MNTFVAPAPRRIYAEYVLDDASFVRASTNISELCVPGTVLGRQTLREFTSYQEVGKGMRWRVSRE